MHVKLSRDRRSPNLVDTLASRGRIHCRPRHCMQRLGGHRKVSVSGCRQAGECATQIEAGEAVLGWRGLEQELEERWAGRIHIERAETPVFSDIYKRGRQFE